MGIDGYWEGRRRGCRVVLIEMATWMRLVRSISVMRSVVSVSCSGIAGPTWAFAGTWLLAALVEAAWALLVRRRRSGGDTTQECGRERGSGGGDGGVAASGSAASIITRQSR